MCLCLLHGPSCLEEVKTESFGPGCKRGECAVSSENFLKTGPIRNLSSYEIIIERFGKDVNSQNKRGSELVSGA